MISAVFDCVVYLQAVLSSKGPAFACLSLAEEEHVTLYFSPDILEEVKRSLGRPLLRNKYSQLTDASVTTFLERVVKLGTLTQNPPALFSLKRDQKDEPYLNLAIEMNASFLVSRDNDLLDLMQDEGFRKAYSDLFVAGYTNRYIDVCSPTAPGAWLRRESVCQSGR